MQVRFFYAPPIFSNKAKVMVLTESGEYYSEFTDVNSIAVEYKTAINFMDFDVQSIETEEFPTVFELNYKEALILSKEPDYQWIQIYLNQPKPIQTEKIAS